MIKTGKSRTGHRWNISEGTQASLWTFAKLEDVESLYTIATKMGCANNFRLKTRTPAPEIPGAEVAAPATASAPAPVPRPVSEVVGASAVVDPAAAVSVTAPPRRVAPMTLEAAPGAVVSSGAAASN
ncbi:MAG: hypothetical protein AAB250_17375 [Bdellovibrionota bacterium]